MLRSLTCHALVLIAFLTNAQPGVAAKPPQPNLVFIFPDQWRGQALGFLSEEPVLTPNLDRMAAESLVLTSAASNYPVCSPYRAMLFTGKYPMATGVLGNCNSVGTRYGYELKQNDRCWSDVLRDAGYSLGYVGKWHLEAPRRPYVKSYNNSEKFAWNEWTPPERRHGFEFWYAYNTFDRHLKPEYWATESRRADRIIIDQWGPEHEADIAVEFLQNADGKFRDPGKPFALVVAMNPPHMPYQQVPQKYIDIYADKHADALLGDRPDLLPADRQMGRYTRRNIKLQYAMMTGVDQQVGRILKALEQANLSENTIVVFTSDHGDCLGTHGQISKNNHYEQSMRIPLLIRWPGHIKPGKDDLLISTPDLYPTLLDVMGFASRIPKEVQGTSFARILRGEAQPRPTSQIYIWMAHDHPELGRRGVRTNRYKLMIERREGKPEQVVLYDRRADPFEMTNIAATQPEIVARLIKDELNPWLQRTGDPWKRDSVGKG